MSYPEPALVKQGKAAPAKKPRVTKEKVVIKTETPSPTSVAPQGINFYFALN